MRGESGKTMATATSREMRKARSVKHRKPGMHRTPQSVISHNYGPKVALPFRVPRKGSSLISRIHHMYLVCRKYPVHIPYLPYVLYSPCTLYTLDIPCMPSMPSMPCIPYIPYIALPGSGWLCCSGLGALGCWFRV